MYEEKPLGKAYDLKLIRRLMTYLRPHRGSAVVAVLVISAAAVLQLSLPYLTKVAIDRCIASGDLAALNRIAILFFGVLVGTFTLEYFETRTLQMIGQRIMSDLRLETYRHLQHLGLEFYDRNPVGRLMTRVTTDVNALNDLFTGGFITVFGDIFLLLGIVIVMLAMDWRLALLGFCVLPMVWWIMRWFRRRTKEKYRADRVLTARINAFLHEHLTGMVTVQLFRQEQPVFEQFESINRQYCHVNIQSICYSAVFQPAIEFIGILGAALLVWQGGNWVIQGTVTLGTLVAFLQYSRKLFQPISDLSDKLNLLHAAIASSERVFALLDESPGDVMRRSFAAMTRDAKQPTIASQNTKTELPQIAFEHVSFAYEGKWHALRDVSFTVASGERVGVVGATGSGKTTLINLLMRFYEVEHGRIVVDGTDVREIGLETLRSRFSLVSQDIHLFSGTIASNIRLGREEITEDAVRCAARTVHADRFIEQLPHGYETPVAERGTTLSVGQKQLLSFARALAFNPEILLLDEATSSIDTETEGLIRDALATLMAGRTTIAVAHRLSTVQDMDKILVLHRGTLREIGTHQELLTRRGIYYKLYQLQYKDQEVVATPQSHPS